jgi:hypothetical protein
MNPRHQPHYASDSESLQADVMRFMAIIAFCLIAVLALVRDAEPPLAPVAGEPVEVSAPDPTPASAPDPRPVAIPKAIRKAVPDFADPLVMPQPVAPAAPETTPAPAPVAPQVPSVEVAVQVPVQPEQATEPVTEEEWNSQHVKDYIAAYELVKREDPGVTAVFEDLGKKYPDDPLVKFHLKRFATGETGVTAVMSEK